MDSEQVEPLYKDTCEPMSTNIKNTRLTNFVFYLKDLPITTLFLSLPVLLITLPLMLLIVPAFCRYQTEPQSTPGPSNIYNPPRLVNKMCDTLSVCIYRLESYIGQNTTAVFCLEPKSSFVDGMTIYDRKNCKPLWKYNSSAARTISKYLKDFFDNEQEATRFLGTSKDKTCPFVTYKPWVTFCFSLIKLLSTVVLGVNVTLTSQEAYRLKIYMHAFV